MRRAVQQVPRRAPVPTRRAPTRSQTNYTHQGIVRKMRIKQLFRDVLHREATDAEVEQWFRSPQDEASIRVAVKRGNAPMISAATSALFAPGRIVSITEVIEATFQMPASDWSGRLIVQHPGKVGEMVFLLALVGPLRAMLPHARLSLRTLSEYGSIAARMRPSFDDIEFMHPAGAGVADRVIYGMRLNVHAGFRRTGPQELQVHSYRSHPWWTFDTAVTHGPFYRAFAEAIGVVPFAMQMPQWDDVPPFDGPLAVAFPTTNKHSSRRQRLPLAAEQWHHMALELRGCGLRPVATGRTDDPAPGDMPGWDWYHCDSMAALTLGRAAKFVIGGNSGVVWASLFLGQGPCVMLDEQSPTALWSGGHMGAEAAHCLPRLRQVSVTPDGARDAAAWQVTLDALSTVRHG